MLPEFLPVLEAFLAADHDMHSRPRTVKLRLLTADERHNPKLSVIAYSLKVSSHNQELRVLNFPTKATNILHAPLRNFMGWKNYGLDLFPSRSPSLDNLGGELRDEWVDKESESCKLFPRHRRSLTHRG